MAVNPAEAAGYADAKTSVSDNPNRSSKTLRPKESARKKWTGDSQWSAYLFGWKSYMAEKRSEDTRWTDASGKPDNSNDVVAKGTDPVVMPQKKAKTVAASPVEAPPTPTQAIAVARTGSTEAPPERAALLAAYPGAPPEWRRGYLDFRNCAINRHCAPSSDSADDWAWYMDGWRRAEQDWRAKRSFPERVRIQIGAKATITNLEDGNPYHLRTTEVVSGERIDAQGRIEFQWSGARYSVWPGEHAQFVAEG